MAEEIVAGKVEPGDIMEVKMKRGSKDELEVKVVHE